MGFEAVEGALLVRSASELEMARRHVRRATELVERHRERMQQFKDPRGARLARELLHELERALELHKAHLAHLLRDKS